MRNACPAQEISAELGRNTTPQSLDTTRRTRGGAGTEREHAQNRIESDKKGISREIEKFSESSERVWSRKLCTLTSGTRDV